MRSFIVFFFCVFSSGVYSAVFFDEQPEIPGHEGQCYDSDGETFYNKLDIMKNESKECIQKICMGSLPESGKIGIQIYSCGKVEAGLGFIIVQDPSKPYPECCPKAVAVDRDSCEQKRQE